MLLELHIKNFAIIEALDLKFNPGLIILTGETGAGKSIIMGALDMLLGQRVDMSTLRKGSEFASVEAVFKIPESVIIYNISNIFNDIKELKTNFLKQPSKTDLSLLQAAFENPEIYGIITYDKDFYRIATSGILEKKSNKKFWLGTAKQFLNRYDVKSSLKV